MFDSLIKVVGHSTNKHSLCKVADFGSRDKTIHLCGDRGGFVITVDGHGLALLKNLSKPLRERLGRFANDLPGKDIAHSVLYHLTLFVAIITSEL